MKFDQILVSILICVLAGCSWSPKKAVSSTNPPKPVKSQFDFGQLKGRYVDAGSPKMFFWPTTKQGGNGEQFEMTFAEQMEARRAIFELSDLIDANTPLIDKIQAEIDLKYKNLMAESVAWWQKLTCYNLCDPDDIFCEPDNSTVLSIDVWKTPNDAREEITIQTCKDNQEARSQIKSQQENEEEERLGELKESSKQATQDLLALVGDQNYFDDLDSFELRIGNVLCESGVEVCKKSADLNAYVFMEFNSELVSNEVGHPLKKVFDVQLDQVDGYLEYSIPASVSQKVSQPGIFRFEMEFKLTGRTVTIGKLTGPEVKADGDFRFIGEDGEQKVGRFSSTGIVEKF